MTTENAAGYVIVIDGLDTDVHAVQVIGKRHSPDLPLLLSRIDGKYNGVLKSILTHYPGQFDHQGSTRSIVPNAKRVAGDVTVVIIAAINVPFHDDDRLVRGL